MDFQLSEDQKALAGGRRARSATPLAVRGAARAREARRVRRASSGASSRRSACSRCACPRREGGVGLGSADAVLVFAELGRRCVPGPLVWSHLARRPRARRGDGREGRRRARPHAAELGAGAGRVRRRPRRAARAARRTASSASTRASSRARRSATPLDPLTPLHTCASCRAASASRAPSSAARLRLEGAALASALCLGIAEMTAELAVDYAKKREQFGRPIGVVPGDQALRRRHVRAPGGGARRGLRGRRDARRPEVGDVERAVASAQA